MRVHIDHDPFIHYYHDKNWFHLGRWPAAWIACPGIGDPPFVTAFRFQFDAARSSRVRFHVAADERYDLYIDGELIGRGNERGSPDLWFYESYDLDFAPGQHTLVARVWSLGNQAAQAQMSVRPGFLFAAEGEWSTLINTGVAAWEAICLPGYTFLRPGPAHWRGARIKVDGNSFLWGFQFGQGEGWQPAQTLRPAIGRLSNWEVYPEHRLAPATLPSMVNRRVQGMNVRFCAEVASMETLEVPVSLSDHLPQEAQGWSRLLSSKGAVIMPPQTTWRVIIDLEDYYCAYFSLVTCGGKGSVIRVQWAESLFEPQNPQVAFRTKGNRNQIEGKYFIGFGDIFVLDGGENREYSPLWWHAGRYIELLVRVGDESLTINQFEIHETRYPLEFESSFESSNPRLKNIVPLLVRGMQMCSNETFFDCPYYEELQYAGDTRLECLVTYCMTRDSRLPRKALKMFDVSRLASGLTQSRYPSRVMQIIAPFSLWWVMMVRDYAYWRQEIDFVRSLLPGVRATLEGFERFIGTDGLLHGPEGWNTFDWVPEWSQDAGVPPDGHYGVSGPLNWQLVYALLQGADLEMRVGEPLLARHFRRRAMRLARLISQAFWNPSRGLFSDDCSQKYFSEHSQCMALLSDSLMPGLLKTDQKKQISIGLLSDPELSRATIYFSHYLFETYRTIGRIDKMLERLSLWEELVNLGFKTPVEMPEPSRSDCHAWGSHPLYHYFATILGIRPGDVGFNNVSIRPQLGDIRYAQGCLVHPAGGEIMMSFRQDDDKNYFNITLPEGVKGRFEYKGKKIELVDKYHELVIK